MSDEGPKFNVDERARAQVRMLQFGHPNRLPGRPKLGLPAMSDPATPETNVLPASPNGKPVLPQWLVLVAAALVALAEVAANMPGMPPIVSTIAHALVALAAVFGIASPGLRKAPEQK